MTHMLELGKLTSNYKYKSDYFIADFETLRISQLCQPGQFLHVKIEGLYHRILRRPFSICDVRNSTVRILYKVVGEGTKFLSELKPGVFCSLLGPCGKGFTLQTSKVPVLICGGYGAAATFFLAKKLSPGYLFCGAKTQDDLVLIEEYQKLNYKIQVSTDDGSTGHKGFVTEIFENFLKQEEKNLANFAFYACGPEGMIHTTAKILNSYGLDGELSLDHKMCCGVGACLACVVKIKTPEGGWKYARTCTEGPVFKASDLFIEK